MFQLFCCVLRKWVSFFGLFSRAFSYCFPSGCVATRVLCSDICLTPFPLCLDPLSPLPFSPPLLLWPRGRTAPSGVQRYFGGRGAFAWHYWKEGAGDVQSSTHDPAGPSWTVGMGTVVESSGRVKPSATGLLGVQFDCTSTPGSARPGVGMDQATDSDQAIDSAWAALGWVLLML